MILFHIAFFFSIWLVSVEFKICSFHGFPLERRLWYPTCLFPLNFGRSREDRLLIKSRDAFYVLLMLNRWISEVPKPGMRAEFGCFIKLRGLWWFRWFSILRFFKTDGRRSKDRYLSFLKSHIHIYLFSSQRLLTRRSMVWDLFRWQEFDRLKKSFGNFRFAEALWVINLTLLNREVFLCFDFNSPNDCAIAWS